MLPMEGKDFLRFALFSGLIGFAVFCISYSSHVWFRRNGARSRPASWQLRGAQIAVGLGIFGISAAWALNEFQGRSGIAGGSDLFVVPARRDSTAHTVTSAETVTKGDIVAEFLSPADRSQLAALDLQQDQARARWEATQSRPLQFDQALLQEQSQLRTQVIQLEGFAFELRKAQREIEKEQTVLLTTWSREKSQLLSDLESAEKEVDASRAQRDLAEAALQRTRELRKRDYTSQQQFEERATAQITAELSLEKQKQIVASLKERLRTLEERFRTSEAWLAKQLAEIQRDADSVDVRVRELRLRADVVHNSLEADRTRASLAREREVEAAEYEVSILAAEKARLIEAAQIRAPFSGQVVFRHAAPGLAPENTPILAISEGQGFTAKIRLPRHELDELAGQTEPVQLALEHPVLHNFFTGRLVHSEPVPFEPGRIIAHFSASLPPEVIASLGSTSEPVRVRLLWRPSLLNRFAFQVSAAVLALGVVGSLLPGRASGNPSGSRAPQENRPASTPLFDPLRIAAASPDDHELRRIARTLHQQLRSGQLDPCTLTESERLIRQHHGRAIRILHEELALDDELLSRILSWLRSQDDEPARRLAAVLTMIWPLERWQAA